MVSLTIDVIHQCILAGCQVHTSPGCHSGLDVLAICSLFFLTKLRSKCWPLRFYWCLACCRYFLVSACSRSCSKQQFAGYNLASAIGRLFFGAVADSRVGPVTTLTIALFLMGVSILSIWTVASSLGLLLLFMVINGSSSGALLSLQPPVNAAVFGMQDMVLTMSMLTFSRSFGSALGGPIAGYLLDASGGPGAGIKAYRPALLIVGSLSVLSSVLTAALRWRIGGWRLSARV